MKSCVHDIIFQQYKNAPIVYIDSCRIRKMQVQNWLLLLHFIHNY